MLSTVGPPPAPSAKSTSRSVPRSRLATVQRFLRRADRILLHPWTSRWGGIQAIAGAAVFAAGLTGGAVTLVFGFPLGWAILTAAGAALLGATGTATALDQYRGRQVSVGGNTAPSAGLAEVRKASGWVLEDLEKARSAYEAALNAGHWWDPKMTTHHFVTGWSEEGEALSIHGYQSEHRAVRAAVRKIDQCEQLCKEAWASYGGLKGPAIEDPRPLRQAVEAIAIAEALLEHVLGPDAPDVSA